MNNINHQKQQARLLPRLPKAQPLLPTPPGLTCNCQLSMSLKLKLINLSSEIQVLKKRLAETEQALERASKFERIFNETLMPVHKKRQQEVERRVEKRTKMLENPKTKTSESDQLSEIMRSAQQRLNEVSSDPVGAGKFALGPTPEERQEDNHKLDSCQYFRRLAAAEDRQTVKSLEFSLDSNSWQGSHSLLPHQHQEDVYSLREEYQRMLQNLEDLSQKKIEQLQQKIYKLTEANEKLEKQRMRGEKTEERLILLSQRFEARQTGYFKTIQEQENEQSMSENEQMQPQDMGNWIPHSNSNQSKSISSENWGEVAEQMRDLKSTLQGIYDFLRTMANQVRGVSQLCKQLQPVWKQFKLVPLQEYLTLIDSKKRCSASLKKCQILQVQNQQLRGMVSQLSLCHSQ